MAVKADKEGELSLFAKEKWKTRYAVLSGGSLLFSKKKGDQEYDQHILLKNIQVKEGSGEEKEKKKKEKSVFTLTADGTTYLFQLENDKDMKSWMDAITSNGNKEAAAGVTLAKKKQSAMMAMKKNISGKAATSGAGKSLIKEQLGNSGVRVLEIVKETITLHEGKKKAIEIEDNLIRFAVKILLLYKNKDITQQELMKCVPYLRNVWSNVIDSCEMSFAYDPPTIKKNMKELADAFEKLVQQHVQDKNIELMRETLAYLTQEALMDHLFKDPAGEEYKKDLERIVRKAWIKLFKDAKK